MKITRALLLATAMLSPALIRAPAAIAATDVGNGDLEEIIVTSQRRAQNLQQIPLTVSALTADQLANTLTTQTVDLSFTVPNFIAHHNTGVGTANSYFIRGLGNTEALATFDPPIGSYIDDIYITRQNANNFAFFDVERIEVLRGPQGTLFGRNTSGGAINMILRKPADSLGGYVEAGYGRFDRVEARASIDAPIAKTLLSKWSGYYGSDDGYVHNITTGETLNNSENYGLRGALRFLPSDRLSWDVAVSYIKDSTLYVPHVLDSDGKHVARTGLSRADGAGSLLDQALAGKGMRNTARSLLLSSNLEYEFEGATLNLITGYLDLDHDFIIDFLNTPFTQGGYTIANDGAHKQFTQEAKLNGQALDGKISYVGGLYFLKEDNRTDFADILTVIPGYIGVPLVTANRLLDNDTRAYSGYGQADYHLSAALTATVGLRFTHEKKTIALTDNKPGGGLTSANMLAAGIPTEQTADIWTPRFALSYAANDDLLLFASATKGFRSGGWNARGSTADQILNFGPEKVWSYEAGFKSDLLDNRLRFNATAFYSDVNDFQLPTAYVRSNSQVVFLTRNFADLEVYGLEAEITAILNRYLSIYGALGLQHAEYANPHAAIQAQQQECLNGGVNCGQGIITPDGAIASPVRTPDATLALGANLDVPVADGWSFFANANGHYVGKHFVGTNNGTASQFAPFDPKVDTERFVVKAAIGLHSADQAWRLSLECRNCTGADYLTASLANQTYLNEPSTWMLRLKYNFAE